MYQCHLCFCLYNLWYAKLSFTTIKVVIFKYCSDPPLFSRISYDYLSLTLLGIWINRYSVKSTCVFKSTFKRKTSTSHFHFSKVSAVLLHFNIEFKYWQLFLVTITIQLENHIALTIFWSYLFMNLSFYDNILCIAIRINFL